MVDLDEDSWSRDLDMEDEAQLNTQILKLVMMRETAVFEHTMLQKYRCNRKCLTVKERIANEFGALRGYDTPRHNNIHDQLDTETLEISSSSSGNDTDEECMGFFSSRSSGTGGHLFENNFRNRRAESSTGTAESPWKRQWSNVEEAIDAISDENTSYFEANTQILRLHVQQLVALDSLCFVVMLRCVEPALIHELFSKDLILSRDLPHIHCLYEEGSMFQALQVSRFPTHSFEPFSLLMSVCVLLYRTRCVQNKARIVELIESKLVPFIHRPVCYHESFAKIACRHFLKAVILNSLFDQTHLRSFLNKTSRNIIENRRPHHNHQDRHHPHLDDDEDEDDDDDDDDLDSEMNSSDEDFVLNNNNANEPNRNNAAQPHSTITVSELIGVSLEEMKETYPISLKNLCRLKIKSNLSDYSNATVDCLAMLPIDLKRFLLFEDEIEDILKLVARLKEIAAAQNINGI